MSKKKKVSFIGARADGQAGVVLDVIAYYSNEFEVTCFFDSTESLKGKDVLGIPVVGSVFEITDQQLNEIDFFHISIGNNLARGEIYSFLKEKGADFLTLIHPSAIVSKSSVLGEGCFVGANAVVQNGSTIGHSCILNTSSIIEHNNVLGDCVQMAPNSTTGGRAKLMDMAFVGIGATVLPDITLEKRSFVGAGTTITKDVPESVMMIGYSARVHTKNIYELFDGKK
ncbi:MAG: acetyltransferase [Bacteriovoracaceae bacterium]|nr:acetyltransferase [Bacteriovoracaceae bacterium]